MKRMSRLAQVVVLFLAVMSLSACGYPTYQPTSQDRVAIEGLIDSFEDGIECYSISLMTGGLASGFLLTLKEGNLEYSKTLSVLQGELEAEEADQRYWRATYGYLLDLGLISDYPSFTDRVATVHSNFSVVEQADGIAPVFTDTGTIDWQFVKMGDYWRVATMTITFNTTASGPAMSKSFALSGSPFFRRSSR